METAVIEQRKDARSELAWPVSVWLPEANRFFNGKSVNVSKGGVYISMPLTAPIKEGHEIEVNFPRTVTLARQKGQYARIKSGKVLRVERSNMLVNASIGLAVQFSG
jgi:hypothetical protein